MKAEDINEVTLISTLNWTWLAVQVMEANDINGGNIDINIDMNLISFPGDGN